MTVALTAMWVHGNALTVESPENLARNGRYGWGADLLVQPGRSTWMHIPVPTPVIIGGVRARLLRVFFLFESSPGQGQVDAVHVYDGSAKVQEFNGLHFSGAHRTGLDGANTFNLSAPHSVVFGIGVTAHYTAAIGIDSPVPPTRVIVGTAGADYDI